MFSTRQVKKKAVTLTLLLTAGFGASITAYGEHLNEATINQCQTELKTKEMKTILIIGIDPHTIDFTEPELPKGLTAEMVEEGTKATVEKPDAIGFKADILLIGKGSTDMQPLEQRLKSKEYSGVLIGNGIRGVASNFILFEQLINAVHEWAPHSRIIFNTLPTDTEEAVNRWL
jgi:hypothetical protein